MKTNRDSKTMRLTTRTFALTAAVCAMVLTASAQTNFDAVAEFSSASNPSAVWSYGYSGAFGSFTLFPTNGAWAGISGWMRGLIYPANSPAVAKNETGSLVVYQVSNIWTNGQMVLHPGPDAGNRYAIVRFTAPASGLYEVQASFVGVNNAVPSGTTTDVHVLVNGVSYFNATISGYDNGASFTSPFTFTLAQGDTLDFVCGDGGNGRLNDATGFAATATLLRAGSRAVIYPAVEIGLATETNKSYQVQWAAQVQTNDWHDFGTPVTGDGGLHYMFDSTRGQPQRFYRVLTTE